MSKMIEVETATKAVRELPALFDAIVALFQTSSGAVGTILVVLWLVMSKDLFRYTQFFGHRSRARSEAIEKYLGDQLARDPNCVATLTDMRDAEIFRVATNIYAEKLRRKGLIDLHAKVQHRVTWVGMRRALPYIEFKRDGTAYLRPFRFWDKVGYCYNAIIFIFALLSAVSLLGLVVFARLPSLEDVLWIMIGFGVAILIAGLALFQSLPDIAAKRIRKELANQGMEPSSSPA